MEIRSKILHKKLVEIKKKDTTIRLFFDNNNNRKTVLRFDGLIFETPFSPLSKEVIAVEDSYTLGIKAISQLRFENKNPENYKQLLIQMRSFGDWKSELICIYKDIKFE